MAKKEKVASIDFDVPCYAVQAVTNSGYAKNIGVGYQQKEGRIRLKLDFLPLNWQGELLLIKTDIVE